MPANAPLLAEALDAAARGWHVFPLRPNDKRPAIRAWEQRATTDPARIRRCWTAGPYNVGIACGPSSLVVVDLDTPKPDQTAPADWTMQGINDGADVFAALCDLAGRPFPARTYAVTTGRGGTHFYYQHPTTGAALRNTAGALGWLIDTRAHGGYVVAAGSVASGRPYTVLNDAPPAPLPEWLAEWLRPTPPPVRAAVVSVPAGRANGYAGAALHRTIVRLSQAGEGRRNHALFMAAQTLGQLVAGGALTDHQVTEALTHAAASIGLSPRETTRTIRSGMRAGARRPRQVAA